MSSDVCFFNDTATAEIYTLSLHDALPISARTDGLARRDDRRWTGGAARRGRRTRTRTRTADGGPYGIRSRSEEHTSELQSRQYLVCRLLLEKKQELVSLTIVNSTHMANCT